MKTIPRFMIPFISSNYKITEYTTPKLWYEGLDEWPSAVTLCRICGWQIMHWAVLLNQSVLVFLLLNKHVCITVNPNLSFKKLPYICMSLITKQKNMERFLTRGNHTVGKFKHWQTLFHHQIPSSLSSLFTLVIRCLKGQQYYNLSLKHSYKAVTNPPSREVSKIFAHSKVVCIQIIQD